MLVAEVQFRQRCKGRQEDIAGVLPEFRLMREHHLGRIHQDNGICDHFRMSHRPGACNAGEQEPNDKQNRDDEGGQL